MARAGRPRHRAPPEHRRGDDRDPTRRRRALRHPLGPRAARGAQGRRGGVARRRRLGARRVVTDASTALAEGDLARFHSESGRIHGAIEAIAGNRLLISTMGPLDERSNRLNIANIQAEPGVRHDEHVRLAEVVAAGDAGLASSVAHAHVEWGRRRTIATLADVPGFSAE
ncbi:FCD domain-containing protein [Rathayibacter sp. VKM Ac-2630]|uniref:FCD domain-containing protein n=1 Tax=Rathayibacter sp. VKM Ac-2630 TaxID=1938617 RepID=UPI001F3B8475|nr:FCD domain-containing protein [Rathayibacter sp. VKM Ac-2630]